MQTEDDRVLEHVSAAFRVENVARQFDQDRVQEIVAAGPRGALALAGISVGVVLALWGAFVVFVYLPRGAIG